MAPDEYRRLLGRDVLCGLKHTVMQLHAYFARKDQVRPALLGLVLLRFGRAFAELGE